MDAPLSNSVSPLDMAPKPRPHMWSALNQPGEDQAGPGRTPIDLDARLRRVEINVAAILRALNGASINATCNEEDGTITVTLTIPGLPSSS